MIITGSWFSNHFRLHLIRMSRARSLAMAMPPLSWRKHQESRLPWRAQNRESRTFRLGPPELSIIISSHWDTKTNTNITVHSLICLTYHINNSLLTIGKTDENWMNLAGNHKSNNKHHKKNGHTGFHYICLEKVSEGQPRLVRKSNVSFSVRTKSHI